MRIIGLEPTNQCNRACRHCFRNKVDAVGFLPLETVDAILSQAAPLGFQKVCLTGGEVALYPELRELLGGIAARGFDFTLVTNGYRFPEYVLPLLLEPGIKERLASVCFSLDGATAATHDGLRGPKSFREVLEGLTLCGNHRLPVSLKTVITTANRGELTDLALLGARLGVAEHGFLCPFPSPAFIRSGLLPSPAEMQASIRWVQENLLGVTSNQIILEGHSMAGVIFNCSYPLNSLNVDYQGNLIFCCTLSHMTQGDGVPTSLGSEGIADLTKTPLKEAIVRQFTLAAQVISARLTGNGKVSGLSPTPCLWCLHYFGKLAWLKDFPDSPWTDWLLSGQDEGPETLPMTSGPRGLNQNFAEKY
jgi:MoaA/NifB/PqqE/SkfB family radical SAM enzyme